MPLTLGLLGFAGFNPTYRLLTLSQIKNRSYSDIEDWIIGGVYPLLVDEEQSTSLFAPIIGKDTLPIAKSSRSLPYIPKTSNTSKIAVNPNGTIRIISPLEIGVSQIGISKNNTFQATYSKIDVATVDIPTKTSIREIGSTQVSSIDINLTKFGSNKTSFTEVNITHDPATKMGTSQVNTAQIFSRQVANRDASKREISSTSSVETQNFITAQTLVDHNISRQVQNIELAAISLSQQQLNSTTPI